MRLSLLVLVLAVALGCEDSLGQCSMSQATAVVYTPDGLPYYEAQALVFEACAGSFCHAAAATRDARYGAPHGANLDIGVLSGTSTTHDLAVLKAGIAKIDSDREGLYDRVESGSMPPGKAGQRPPLAWKRDVSGTLTAAVLPAVSSAQGKELLRNWLACGAPVVAATTDFSASAAAAKLGAVLPGRSSAMTATFQSIYDGLLGPKCVACHNSVAGNPYLTQQQLDFGDADKAYASLLGKAPFGRGACAGKSQLVVAGDCKGSLLYQKLALTTPPVCGSPMPLGGATTASTTLAVLCQWIDAGAKR
ncbi:MAG TPA: hypothetical protein VF331_10140 [Polyangiales bacterium]